MSNQSFGLVRDKDGNPRIDDPANTHPAILVMMSPDERAARNIWDGPFAVDAQGTKRLRAVPGGFEAVDALVAVSAVLVDANTSHSITPRRDVPAGGILDILEG